MNLKITGRHDKYKWLLVVVVSIVSAGAVMLAHVVHLRLHHSRMGDVVCRNIIIVVLFHIVSNNMMKFRQTQNLLRASRRRVRRKNKNGTFH